MIEIYRGDVVWVRFPRTPSQHVQFGVRPAVVVQNNGGNAHSPTTMVVPLTGHNKRLDLHSHVPIDTRSGVRRGTILCESVMVIDRESIVNKVGHLPKATLRKVNDALRASLGLEGEL